MSYDVSLLKAQTIDAKACAKAMDYVVGDEKSVRAIMGAYQKAYKAYMKAGSAPLHGLKWADIKNYAVRELGRPHERFGTHRLGILGAMAIHKGLDISGILASEGLQVEYVSEITRDTVQDLYDNPQKVFRMTSRSFEALSAELYRGCGWNAVLTKQSHDDGVDVWLDRSDGGIPFTVIVQCKYRRTPNGRVGVPEIRALLGTVKQHDAPKGILATTGKFTRAALRLLKKFATRLHGVDFDGLLSLMRRYLHLNSPRPCTIW